MIEWSVCVVLGTLKQLNTQFEVSKWARFMSLLFILKSERDSSVNTRSVFMSWSSSPKQCSAKTGTLGEVFPSSFGQMSAWAVAQWADQGNDLLEVFLPSSVQNSFQPDHFLLPAPRAGSMLETQRWAHLQQISLRSWIFTSAIRHNQPDFCRHSC